MQSLVVYSSRVGYMQNNSKSTSKLAISLIKNILNQYTCKSTLIQERTYTLINKLIQSMIGSSCSSLHLNNHSSSSSSSSFLQPRSLLFGRLSLLPSTSEPPFIIESTLDKSLQLTTAYSGYSKDYLNSTYNTNIQTAKISLSTTTTTTTTTSRFRPPVCFSNKKKGVIGDDAWFIAKQKCADVLGVADGVGGWHDIGIDPSKFSFNLMKTCKRLVEQDADLCINNKTPINLLEESYKTLLDDKNNSLLIGSSTACILLFHRATNLLHTCNLGDSGFVIIRNHKVIHRSQEQQHYFNSPYQMAILPVKAASSGVHTAEGNRLDNNAADTESLINDSPQSAISSSIELKEGDFIVIGTDGIWDNLTESHLLIEIGKMKSYLMDDLQNAANNIARKAIELALDPDYLSPFAKAARNYGINISGGKPDDITVLLARVSNQCK